VIDLIIAGRKLAVTVMVGTTDLEFGRFPLHRLLSMVMFFLNE
jgi:hypothetical protein